jgi:alpha-glucosidase
MVLSSTLLGFLFSLGLLHVTHSQVCTDVYPHLSCGLSYSTQSQCEAVGCCWDSNTAPSCFAPKINGKKIFSTLFCSLVVCSHCLLLPSSGYRYTETERTSTSITGTLSLSLPSEIFSNDFQNLNLQIVQETSSRTHLQITPTGTTARWEVPSSVLPRPGGSSPMNEAESVVIITSPADDPNQPMELVISRQENGLPTGELIFILSKMLVFQDQYLQFVLGTSKDVIASYGFGESTRDTQHLQDGVTYTLWNTDYLAALSNASLYGSHPFMIQVTSDGKAHGLFFLNSNGMDVTFANSDTQGRSIGIQSTGGILDLYIFSGSTPAEVISQYLEVIGRPAMMPYWSLGFHNCRYGYPSVAYVQDVVTNYSLAEIPLETQWMDIDYMDAYLDFTVDPVTFSSADMTTFINNLHSNNQKFVPIIDPGIYVRDEAYPAYVRGLEQNVFIKDMTNTQPYLGQVWPGPTYFPDWFAENATSWWVNELVEFQALAAYDG